MPEQQKADVKLVQGLLKFDAALWLAYFAARVDGELFWMVAACTLCFFSAIIIGGVAFDNARSEVE